MKNFDTERKARKPSEEARTFLIGGEVFVLKSGIHPSVLERYDAITEDSTINETLTIVDELIGEMIESKDDAIARYAMVRAETNDPVTLEDLQELVKWMVELQSGATGPNPTSAPGDSSSGPERTGTSSTEDSSRPVVRAVPTV